MKKSILHLLVVLFIGASLIPGISATASSPSWRPAKTSELKVDDFEALRSRLEAMPPMEMDEVIWLARCIYSESNLPHEQEHIAWVVRNRVDTQYRGETYREVILEPLQFSLFNTNTPRRTYILGLNQNSRYKHWQKALSIAADVYEAAPSERPFSVETRHFYSPVSMKGKSAPDWAKGVDPLNSADYGIDADRFLFFEEIDASKDPFTAIKTPGEHIASAKEETSKKLEPVRQRKTSLRERWKPSGRVARPARPNTKPSTGTRKRMGW